jgi:hypothetical protein
MLAPNPSRTFQVAVTAALASNQMRPLIVLAIGVAAIVPAAAHAQYPGGYGGSGYGGRGGRGGGMGGGQPESSPTPSKPKLPKSDEMISLQPLLRGVQLTTEQLAALKVLEEKYNPMILPALDAVRAELEVGANGDAEKVTKYSARANRYRDQEVAELKAALTPEQLPRFERNVVDMRAKYGQLLARP